MTNPTPSANDAGEATPLDKRRAETLEFIRHQASFWSKQSKVPCGDAECDSAWCYLASRLLHDEAAEAKLVEALGLLGDELERIGHTGPVREVALAAHAIHDAVLLLRVRPCIEVSNG